MDKQVNGSSVTMKYADYVVGVDIVTIALTNSTYCMLRKGYQTVVLKTKQTSKRSILSPA